MEEEPINLFNSNQFRIKRKNNFRSDNPIEELSDRIHTVIEDIAIRNKRFKPVCLSTFNCDFFTVEESKNDRKIVYNLINPSINVNIQMNNPTPVVNNNNLPLKNPKKSVEGLNENKVNHRTSSFPNNTNLSSNQLQSSTTITNNNNGLLNRQKKEEEKRNEASGIFPQDSNFFGNQSTNNLFSLQNNHGNNTILSIGSLFGSSANSIVSGVQRNQDNSFNITNKLKKEENENNRNKNLLGQINNLTNPPVINNTVNSLPSNVQIQINLPISNNNPLQIDNNNNNLQSERTIANNINTSGQAPSNSNPSKAFQQKLVLMSDNYNKMKLEIEKISKNPNHLKGINNIIDKINLKFNQISTDDSIKEVVNESISILNELEKSNQDDLYIYTIDYICKRVITKAEGYSNDLKINIHRLSKIVAALDQNVAIFGDFFISILTFRCPLVIPKIYLMKECKSQEEYSKKMGFAYVNQNATEHLSDMESHAYLFFGFIQQEKNRKYTKYIQFFIENLFTESCIYPMAAVVNGFLDSFGNTFKQNYESFFNGFLTKLPNWIKTMEETKNKCKSSDIKSKVNTHLHFIKKNLDLVKKNSPTTMFKQ